MGNNPLASALALVPKVKGTQGALAGTLINREDEILATTVAMVCDQALFMGGDPGLAKTLVAEMMMRMIGGRAFTALMPGIADPDDLFVEGISVLKQDEGDGLIRTIIEKTPGKAATAQGVLLDEIWKVQDPRVLQALIDLTLSDGIRLEGQRLADQARLVVGISNETPEPGGEFDALWARFLLRVWVKPLDRSGLRKMVRVQEELAQGSGSSTGPANLLTVADVDVLQAAWPHVTISDDILDAVYDVIEALVDRDREAFDWLRTDNRRFGLMVRALKAHALIHGRSTVSKADLGILRWMMWNHPDHIEAVEEETRELCATPISEAREELDDLLAPGGKVQRAFEQRDTTVFTDAAAQINRLKDEVLPRLISQASGSEADRLQEMQAGVQRLFTAVMARISGQEAEMSWDEFISLLKR